MWDKIANGCIKHVSVLQAFTLYYFFLTVVFDFSLFETAELAGFLTIAYSDFFVFGRGKYDN